MAAPTNEGAAPPSPPACTVIAAVLQNRAREVGVALFDKRGGPSLDLEQHVEVGESHATTLCELQRAIPGVILTVAGDRGGALGDAVRVHRCTDKGYTAFAEHLTTRPARSCQVRRAWEPFFLSATRVIP